MMGGGKTYIEAGLKNIHCGYRMIFVSHQNLGRKKRAKDRRTLSHSKSIFGLQSRKSIGLFNNEMCQQTPMVEKETPLT